MVNFTARPLFPGERSPAPTEQDAGWAHRRSGRFGEEQQVESQMWPWAFREAGEMHGVHQYKNSLYCKLPLHTGHRAAKRVLYRTLKE
jgi:hypothetical protein